MTDNRDKSDKDKSDINKSDIGLNKSFFRSLAKDRLGKVIIVSSCIIMLLILICTVKAIIPNAHYEYEVNNVSDRLFNEAFIGEEQVLCSDISLPAGIYKFSLKYELLDQDMSLYVNAKDNSVYDRALMSEGNVLWKGTDEASFTVRLYESTDEMSVVITNSGKLDPIELKTIVIDETSQLWTVMIVNLIFLWILVTSIILFIYCNKNGMLTNDQKIPVLGIAGCTLLGALIFMCGALPSGADTGYHLERIESVAYSIRDGIFPIRIEPFYPFGYGYANGIFYCDLSLYFPALFRLAGFSVQSSYNIFGITSVFLGVLAGFYCFNKIFKNVYAGLLGTALYNLAMYHMFDAELRGGTGFLIAGIFLPILVYGYYRLFSEDINDGHYKTTWITIAIGYTGLVCSHILSMEIAAFWTIVVILTMLLKVFRKKTFIELLKALGGVIALNVWFLIPFLDYFTSEDMAIKHATARQIQEAGLGFSNYIRWPFVPYVDSINFPSSMKDQSMNTVYIIALAAFIVLWIAGVWKRLPKNQFMAFAKVCSIYSIISIVLSLRIFPWNYLHALNPIFEKIISVLQFPFRFLCLADMFISVVIVALVQGIWMLKEKVWRYVVTSLTVLSILVYSCYVIEYSIDIEYGRMQLTDMTMQVGYLSGGEYVVHGTQSGDIRPMKQVATSDGISLSEYEKNDLKVSVTVTNETDKEGYIEVPLLHYKGYKAWAGDGTQLSCTKGTNNIVRVSVPANYSGNIEISFSSPWYWRVSEAISYASWLALLIYVICKKRRAAR